MLLFCNKVIVQVGLPISHHLWHALEVLECLAKGREKLLNQIEAIIPNLFRSRILSKVQSEKLMGKVITDIVTKLIP